MECYHLELQNQGCLQYDLGALSLLVVVFILKLECFGSAGVQ